MNADTVLDTTATETLVRFLDFTFGSRPSVRVKFTLALKRHGRGTYYPGRRGQIRVSRKAPLWVVCHEYAHHLDYRVNSRLVRIGTRDVRLDSIGSEGHSESFYRNLRRVINAIGVIDYPWSREYRQVARWAKRDGL